MNIWFDEIEKARSRAAGLDIEALAASARGKAPKELSSERELVERRQFLRESMGDEEKSQKFFERIINGSDIQDANYLARGARAAKAIARVVIRDPSGRLRGYGTGFIIAPRVLITNNHVLPDDRAAIRSEAQFEYEIDIDLRPLIPITYSLNPSSLFFTSKALDFTVVAIDPVAVNGPSNLASYGCLPLVGQTGKVADGEWLTIVQHPNGERKQLCVRENKLIMRQRDVLWYTTDTLGGSSGSPVFNNDWYVVALHHSGIPEEKNGRPQTIFGRDFDPNRDAEQDIKWKANEGIRVSRIVATLQQQVGDHPLLRPIFRATPESARIAVHSASVLQSSARPVRASPVGRTAPLDERKDSPMSEDSRFVGSARTVTVTLSIDEYGAVTLLGSGTRGAQEALSFFERARKEKSPAFDVPFDATYADRRGYDSGILNAGGEDDKNVFLPKLSAALEAASAKLLKPQAGNNNVLLYHNYSVVMHEQRRFAIYSAANVDFAGRFELARPEDLWRSDPRIPARAQITNFYYKSNQFDRGHLTRREDLEYGASFVDALTSAADTCHYTNAVPQHARFNQNRELWQGIERHLLENAITRNSFRAQVITGPILEEDDPVWSRFPDIQYPVRFWKVVAAVSGRGELFATAYILDQSDVIDEFGIEVVPEVPFAAYKTFQVPVAEVERLTQLTFTGGQSANPVSLTQFDPLRSGVPRRRTRSLRREEEALRLDVPESYLPLESLEAIQAPL